MSAIIVAGNEIIPDTLTVTVDGTEITAKDFQKVLLNINQASATASVADGTDLMQKMEIINKNANACDVSFKGEGGATVKNLKQNQSMRLSWTGSFWYVTFGGLLSGVANDGTSFNYTTEVTLDEVPVNTTYSTTEQDTGMTWIDGKKIYKITLYDDTIRTKALNTELSIYLSTTGINAENIIRQEGSWVRVLGSDVYTYDINMCFAAANGTVVYQSVSTQYYYNSESFRLYFRGSNDLTVRRVMVTLYYTKTTD